LRLKFKKEFKSISSFTDIELPNLSVITGLNGTGKSHLLLAINSRSIVAEGDNQNKIVFFNNTSFNLTYEKQINSKSLEEHYVSAIAKFNSHKSSIYQIISRHIDYDSIKTLCSELNKSFIELTENDFTEKDAFEKYSEAINEYKRYLLSIQLPNQTYGISHGESFLHLASKITYSVHELSDDEFKKLFVPYVFANYLLPSELGKTFWDYYLKYENNKYLEYFNSRQPDEKQTKTYTDEEFESIYGRKPWVVINEILEDFDSIDYRVNSPERLSRDDSYDLRLISNSNKSISISYSDLSSGERILMALVGLIYRLRLDDNLPDLILFDEVDASLHPSMIKMFLKVIDQTLIAAGKKVILVTHSPTMVALSPENSIYLMNKSGPNRLEKKSKQDALAVLTEGYATLEQGLKLFDEVVKSKISIITEGHNAKLIQKACELLGCDDIEVILKIEHISGKNQLKTLYDFLSKVPHENKVIFVWDCDVNYTLTDSNNTYAYILETNPLNKIATKGIENMFSEDLFTGFIKTISLSNGETIREFDGSRKRDFESFLMHRNSREDFSNFQKLIEKIEEIKN
jgi:predicted ATPase